MIRYEISTDPERLDRDAVHRWLSDESYWAKGRSREDVEHSIANSINFGAYRDGEQVAFARVVSDRTTFAWICDVFVAREHRANGLGKQLVTAVLAHPETKRVYRWVLATADAHDLYRRYGFHEIERPERFLVIEPERLASICADG